MSIDKSDKKCKMISEFKIINFEFKTMEGREFLCILKTSRDMLPKNARPSDKMER